MLQLPGDTGVETVKVKDGSSRGWCLIDADKYDPAEHGEVLETVDNRRMKPEEAQIPVSHDPPIKNPGRTAAPMVKVKDDCPRGFVLLGRAEFEAMAEEDRPEVLEEIQNDQALAAPKAPIDFGDQFAPVVKNMVPMVRVKSDNERGFVLMNRSDWESMSEAERPDKLEDVDNAPDELTANKINIPAFSDRPSMVEWVARQFNLSFDVNAPSVALKDAIVLLAAGNELTDELKEAVLLKAPPPPSVIDPKVSVEPAPFAEIVAIAEAAGKKVNPVASEEIVREAVALLEAGTEPDGSLAGAFLADPPPPAPASPPPPVNPPAPAPGEGDS